MGGWCDERRVAGGGGGGGGGGRWRSVGLLLWWCIPQLTVRIRAAIRNCHGNSFDKFPALLPAATAMANTTQKMRVMALKAIAVMEPSPMAIDMIVTWSSMAQAGREGARRVDQTAER